MKTKILSILALLLMTVTQGAWAQETLTVFDGAASSEYIPMYGYYFDAYTKSECIIPASELTAMEGGTITAITFYAKTVAGTNSTFGTANQKVFLKEVSETTLGYFSDMIGATVVFDGSLPMPTTSASGYTITFSQGYTYNGGNLLIGVYNDANGSYNDVTWYGNNNQSDRVSAYGNNASGLDNVGFTAQSFLPKTTFTYTTPGPFSGGSGTQASPYEIASTTDWNNLVTAVNAGETYSGKYFKMTANVATVSTWMTGTFSGTFDGDGKTLTVGYSTSARYCAPFGTLGGTVKNLRVAGTVSTSAGADSNSGKNFGGIAAQVTSGKTATIQNCRVSATLTSTLSGDTSSGGFVGVVWSGGTLNMTGCAFTGSLQGSGATACGGFLGYKEGTCSMTDCLFAPASVTMSTLYAGTFSRPSAPTITNCYFTRTFGGAQGMQARTIVKGDGVSTLSVTKGSGTTYNVAGITVYSNGVDYNSTFYGGSGQTVSLALTAETRSGYQFTQYAASQGTLSAQTATSATLTMPAANSTANDAVTVTAQYFSGSGTESSPYLIASTTDWNNLVSAVNAGETYSGNYFKMTANVGTVTTWMTGTFSGTFDGDGKTLTVDYTATSQRCGAFGYLGSASIQNLKVAGTISTAYQAAGGLATWCNEGASAYITNCRVSTIISSSVSGDGTHGGFVAYTDGKLYFTGCVFDGSLTGSTTNACSGFVYNSGWNGAAVSLTDCLLAPSSVTIGTGASATFVRGTAPTITNCYYTQTLGTAQGLQARTIAKGDYVSTLAISGDGTEYDVSGITAYSGGISFNDGSTTTFYGGSGQTVSLDLTAETRTGYQFKQYAASQGSLSGQTTDTPTLTMPDANSTANDVVTISAEYDPTYNATFADGNDNDGWTIDPTSGVAGTSVTVSYTGENKVKSVTVAPKGALTGKFSVSSTKQVQFSKGNLQYDGSAWSFHTNQYDCVFTSISTATDYPMDIFCWGNIDNPAYDGSTGIGTNGVDLSGSSDWGSNTITNGCTGWRTLTLAEWEYLFANHSYGYATVAGQTGVIILPDVFTDPMRNNGSAAFAASTASWTANVYAAGDDWTAMEKAGALFLPAAGGRDGSYIGSVGIKGSYWSSTAYTTHGRFIVFQAGSAPETTNYSIHGYGKSVRLVKDVTVTKLALCSLSEVTSEHVGKIIGADGNVYASLAQAEKVTTAVGILGKVTETGHGLIMSLEDAPQQVWATIDGWASASYAGTTLKVLPDDDARGSNLPNYTTLGSTTVSNWAVATRDDYTAIFTNLGSTGDDSNGISYNATMNAKITSTGGTAISGDNWSSTQYDSSKAWRFAFTWGARDKTYQFKVRPVLGF